MPARRVMSSFQLQLAALAKLAAFEPRSHPHRSFRMDAVMRARTRALNDQLRRHLIGGRVLLTPGIVSMGRDSVVSVMTAVATFDGFNADNDPYDEHDFGAVRLDDQQVFWKISYYDATLTAHSEDPTDPETCVRVLTVMLAEEY